MVRFAPRALRVQNLASSSLESNFSVSFRPQINLTQTKVRAETTAYPRNTFVCWPSLSVRQYVTTFLRCLALPYLPGLEIRDPMIVVMKFKVIKKEK